MLEMTTGQKIPQMTGTIGEIQAGIQNIQMTLSQVIQHQQQLEQRLIALENNATNQFTNLVQQVQSIKSIRLSHSQETKAIEFKTDGNDYSKSPHYNKNN
jgi:TolA-binding protein